MKKNRILSLALVGTLTVVGLSMTVLWKMNILANEDKDKDLAEITTLQDLPLNIADPGAAASAKTDAMGASANVQELTRLKGDMAQLREAMLVLIEHQSRTQKSIDQIHLSLDRSANQAMAREDAVEETPEVAEQRIYQQVAVMQDTLEAQSVDPQWAQETISKIENQLAQDEMTGFSLVEAKCGSTLCKVEMALDPKLTREESMQRLAQHRSWDGPTFFSVGANGQTQLFFARSGHQLPN